MSRTRTPVCSLGFSDKWKRVVLDRCCPVPKQRSLSTSIYQFAGFRLEFVRDFFFSVAEFTHTAEAPWAPSQELTFQASLLWLTRYVGKRSHMYVGYDQTERHASNVSLRVGDIVAPTPSAWTSISEASIRWTAWCLASWTTVAPPVWARSP